MNVRAQAASQIEALKEGRLSPDDVVVRARGAAAARPGGGADARVPRLTV